MTNSRSGLLIGVLVFYIILVTLTGLLLSSEEKTNYTDTGLLSYIPFASEIISGFSSLPAWANYIIFTPLIIIVGWVLLTSFIPTTNAGA